MKTSPAKLTQIVHTFRPEAVIGELIPLKGGISSGMAAFDVTSAGETERMILREPGEWSLKRDPHTAKTEFAILEELGRQGFPAQKPYYSAPREADVPLLIIEYLHGSLNLGPSCMSSYGDEMARTLARLHTLDVVAFPFIRSMAEDVASTIVHRHKRQKPVADEIAIRELIEARWPFARQNQPAVLHGDFWPGNVLWADEMIIAPIDWEDAGIGDPLLDIAVSRQELSFAFGVDAAEIFTAAYRRITTLDWSNLPLWDVYASLRPIDQFSLWASSWSDLGRPEISADTMRAARTDLVTRAFAAL